MPRTFEIHGALTEKPAWTNARRARKEGEYLEILPVRSFPQHQILRGGRGRSAHKPRCAATWRSAVKHRVVKIAERGVRN